MASQAFVAEVLQRQDLVANGTEPSPVAALAWNYERHVTRVGAPRGAIGPVVLAGHQPGGRQR